MKLAFYPESRNSMEWRTSPRLLPMTRDTFSLAVVSLHSDPLLSRLGKFKLAATYSFSKLTFIPILWNHFVRT